jgi:macrolide transport system ATP-binding/permease protein
MNPWRLLRACLQRFSAVFKGSQSQQSFADEIESHLQLHIEDNLRLGMTPEQARREAILKLGGVEMTKQSYRERNTLPLLDDLLQDLRFALRQLRRSPAFTITAALMLSLGIGASVAIFAFVDAALLKPLPYRDPTRLAGVNEAVKLFGRAPLSYPDYLDWKRLNNVFSSMDVFTGTGFMLNTSSGAEPVEAARVSDGFFRTLGTTPVLGRDFYQGEDLPSAQSTMILNYATWKLRFAGRMDIVGQVVQLSGEPYTIVGVLPEDFHFALDGGAEFWVPFHAKGECDLRRSCHSLHGIGRLKDGVTIQAAQSEMQSIASQLERQYPGDNRGQGATIELLSELIVGDIRPILLTFLAAAGLLLAIACVNVASLLLVGSESRSREIAVRGALGASRVRIVRQFLTEGLMLVTLGCVLGLGLAGLGMRLLVSLIPKHFFEGMPFFLDLGLGWHAIVFTGVIAGMAGVLFAVTPLLRLPLTALRFGLAEGYRGSTGTVWRRFGSSLVVLELMIAVVLLVGAGLLGKSLYQLLHVNLSFNPDHLAILTVEAPPSLYPKDENLIALQRQIISRISALPGVESVGLTSVAPVSFNGNTDWIRFVGRPFNGEHNEVNLRDVSADYIKMLQAKLLRGRLFSDSVDGAKPKVVVINQKLAEMYYSGQNPIGQRFGNGSLDPNSIKEIIGVVDDSNEGSLGSPIWPAVYYPIYQDEDNSFTLMVRTSQSEASILPALVSTIHSIDRGVGTRGESTMSTYIHDSPAAYIHRSCAWLVGGFAALALVLSMAGLYGVIAYSVSQRTREIGVRMALGAQRSSVYQLILREAARLTLVGIVLGLIGAVGAATLMRTLLFGTAAWDVGTLASVAVVLGGCALLASYIPARRAASVNPVEALRAE